MVVAFYFRLHLAYFPRPVVAIFAGPEQQLQSVIIVKKNCEDSYGSSQFFFWGKEKGTLEIK